MPRILIPSGFTPVQSTSHPRPSFSLQNSAGHKLSIHAVSPSIVRVVHELPHPRFHRKFNGHLHWEEECMEGITVQHEGGYAEIDTGKLIVHVAYNEGCPRLQWYTEKSDMSPFLADSITQACAFDGSTGGVFHYVE